MKTTSKKKVDSGLQNRIAQSSTETTADAKTRWHAVHFHGPEPKRNKDGDEIPVWFVYLGDADGKPVSTCYTIHAFSKAARLAELMSRDRQLELINEAQPA